MEPTLGLLGGASSGVSVNESVVEQDYVGMSSEASSYPSESELELGLGLSLGNGGKGKVKGCVWGERGRILTAKDFPSVFGSSSSSNRPKPNSSLVAVSGVKRAADSVSQEGGSPPRSSQVVGWPPIRAYRMNSLASQAKTSRAEVEKSVGETENCANVLKKKVCNGNKNNTSVKEKGLLGFVKVNMDGIPIGRKVDLSAHSGYETLALMLEDMFFNPTATISSSGSGGEKEHTTKQKQSKLLDGSSEFVLTYEDKEGDWMLVGDVPWGMFISTVKRLRIMRTSEANGLAPFVQGRNDKQRSKPI